MKDKLAKSTQENLITLLCFDEEHSKTIRNAVDLDLFEGPYRDIASQAILYLDQFGAPPKEHISDLFEEVLEGKDRRKASLFERLLFDLYESRESVNVEYTIAGLTDFVRQQNLKVGIMEAASIIQSEQEGYLDTAEEILTRAMKRQLDLFDPGASLSDMKRSFRFLTLQDDVFRTGIPELDYRNLGPVRKGLHLYIALTKRGKTWWLCHLGKLAFLHKLKVCHITLEISEEKVLQRYYQSLFTIAKRAGSYPEVDFTLDELGRLIGLKLENLRPRLTFEDPKIHKKLSELTSSWGIRLGRVIVKEFPSGSLTIRNLEGYLDSLEAANNFIPDLLILDYADLMSVSSQNYRESLGRLYVDLRGLAGKRNIAIATASQAHRSAIGQKRLHEGNVAEDWSKVQTADTIITYSQTEAERILGLARLFVAGARDDADKIEVLISQNYPVGQFMRNSTLLVSRYWKELEEFTTDEEEEEEEEEDD